MRHGRSGQDRTGQSHGSCILPADYSKGMIRNCGGPAEPLSEGRDVNRGAAGLDRPGRNKLLERFRKLVVAICVVSKAWVNLIEYELQSGNEVDTEDDVVEVEVKVRVAWLKRSRCSFAGRGSRGARLSMRVTRLYLQYEFSLAERPKATGLTQPNPNSAPPRYPAVISRSMRPSLEPCCYSPLSVGTNIA